MMFCITFYEIDPTQNITILPITFAFHYVTLHLTFTYDRSITRHEKRLLEYVERETTELLIWRCKIG